MLLDIVILPPAGVSQTLVRKVKRASKGLSAVYIVGSNGLVHHSSLFHVNVSRKQLPNVLGIVGGLAAHLPKVNLVSKGAAYDGDGVWAEFSRPVALVSFKNNIVSALAPLRQATMPYTSGHPLTPLRRHYRKRFGVHYNMGRYFRPHLTLAKYKKLADAMEVSKLLKHLKVQFMVTSLAVTEVNRYHQVTRILKRFRV